METFVSLISVLKGKGVLRNKKVFDAFVKIDRRYFVPKDLQDFAYDATPLPIGGGQTISQPYTVVFMLELLDVQKGDKVLDVGSGSGYTTALLSELVGDRGRVVGVEIIPELVTLGKKNLSHYHPFYAEIYQSGEEMGRKEEAPYDKILVSAGSNTIPQELLKQLKKGGRMVIPIEDGIWKIEKKADDTLNIEKHHGFAFVPLV